MSGWKSCRFIFPLDDLGTRTIKERKFSMKNLLDSNKSSNFAPANKAMVPSSIG